MTNIKITEENKEMYQKFCKLMTNQEISKETIVFISVFTSIFLISALGINTIFLDSLIANLVSVFFLVNIMAIIVEVGHSIEKNKLNKKIKKFQQEYPDFDINVDVYKVKKELIKYQLNKTPIYSVSEINEINKEIFIQPSNLKQARKNNQIDYLKQEKTFLIQCKENENKEEKSVQKIKKFK